MSPSTKTSHNKKKKILAFDVGGSPDILPLIRRKIQVVKIKSSKKTKKSVWYKGVRRCSRSDKWKAQIKIKDAKTKKKKKVTLGRFTTEEEAAHMYAKAEWCRKYSKTPREIVGGMDLTDVTEDLPLIPSTRGQKRPYKNIAPKGKLWTSTVCYKRKRITLLSHKTPEEAALMAARAEYYVQSLPKDVYGGLDLSQTPTHLKPIPNNHPDSKYPYLGIDQNNKGIWRAHIYMEGGKKHLGTFDTAEEAGTVHVRAMYHLGWVPHAQL